MAEAALWMQSLLSAQSMHCGLWRGRGERVISQTRRAFCQTHPSYLCISSPDTFVSRSLYLRRLAEVLRLLGQGLLTCVVGKENLTLLSAPDLVPQGTWTCWNLCSGDSSIMSQPPPTVDPPGPPPVLLGNLRSFPIWGASQSGNLYREGQGDTEERGGPPRIAGGRFNKQGKCLGAPLVSVSGSLKTRISPHPLAKS